jgi:hypothetical protein
MNLLYIAFTVASLIRDAMASYADGRMLFTETIQGTCDATTSEYYIYNYE